MTREEQERIARDIDAGWKAARAGQPRDDTKSEAWLYGYSKGDSPHNPARWETPLYPEFDPPKDN